MIRQLSVFVENKPGSFRQVMAELHREKIEVYAFCSVDSPEFGILRLIVGQPQRAEELLVAAGFMVKNYDVIAVKTDRERTMEDLLGACHESNISINYMYSSFGSGDGNPTAVFHCEYVEETESMLRARGFVCI